MRKAILKHCGSTALIVTDNQILEIPRILCKKPENVEISNDECRGFCDNRVE